MLIAEDNKINQLVADRILRRMGCTTTIVENGQLAIEASEKNGFDLILMDCQMPVVDGYEATRQIRLKERQTPDAPAIPIIAITAHAQERDRVKCFDAGMNDYLAKPFTQEHLTELVRKYARSQAGESKQPPR
ncbi:MAG: response regulator [Verrucomicrobia bacterium]|nr:response regulator [Verrucomicrobiota bacterium]